MYTLRCQEFFDGEQVDDYRMCTGYVDPRYYTFSTLEEAKAQLAHHCFEGGLSEDGMKKSYREDDGTWIEQYVAPLRPIH